MRVFLFFLLVPFTVWGQVAPVASQFYSKIKSQPIKERLIDLPTTQWLDVADVSWFSGSQDTYEISTAEELAGVAQLVLGGESFAGVTLNLNNDLDLGAHLWTPIGGGVDFPFSGVFNGNNHTVSNLKINLPNASFIGLFGHVVEAKIENLKLETAEIYGKDSVGSIVGNVYTSEVYNCHANQVLVEASEFNIGGLSGAILTGSTMENCSATNVQVSGEGQIGGLLGSVWDSSTLKSSYSTGEVSGGYIIGGLVGYTTFAFNSNVNVVDNCYSQANASANLGRAGGFYGMISGALEVKNSYATGTATAPEFAGGFVGVLTNMIASNNHFDQQTSGHTEAIGEWEGASPVEMDIMARNSEDMKTQAFVDELNQGTADADVWSMGEDWNNYYPILSASLAVEDQVGLNVEPILYPNPLVDYLYLKSSEPVLAVEIYHANGQKVGFAKKDKLSVSHLPKGLYFVKIQTKNKVYHKKFIKK